MELPLRLIARIFALLLIPFAAGAQTVTVPKITQPAQTITITTSKQGGKVAFTIPAQVIAEPTVVPVTIPTVTFTVVCTIPSDSNIITNPDGTKTVTGMKCSFTPVTP